MAWLQSDLKVCGRGKQKANSAVSLKFLSGNACQEGEALNKDDRHNKRKKIPGWKERSAETSDTGGVAEPPEATLQGGTRVPKIPQANLFYSFPAQKFNWNLNQWFRRIIPGLCGLLRP